jgi:hypothetical protein
MVASLIKDQSAPVENPEPIADTSAPKSSTVSPSLKITNSDGVAAGDMLIMAMLDELQKYDYPFLRGNLSRDGVPVALILLPHKTWKGSELIITPREMATE